jgi:hypothetical protein
MTKYFCSVCGMELLDGGVCPTHLEAMVDSHTWPVDVDGWMFVGQSGRMHTNYVQSDPDRRPTIRRNKHGG